jgi:hypothetical protein
MPETLSLQVYHVKELLTLASPDVCEQVRNTLKERISDDWWLHNLTLKEMYEEHISEAGLDPDDLELYFSLSHCQGDGCSFTGNINQDDLVAFLEKSGLREQMTFLFLDGVCWIHQVRITSNSSLYCHHKTMDFLFDWEEEPEDDDPAACMYRVLEDKMNEYEEMIGEALEKIASAFTPKGYAQLEYFSSDKHLNYEIDNDRFEDTRWTINGDEVADALLSA